MYPPQEVCPSCIHTDKYAPYQKVCWVRFQYLEVYPRQEAFQSCIHTEKYAPYQKVCWVRFQYLVVYPRQEVYQSCIHTERSDPIKRCDGFVSNTKRCIHIKRCDSLYPHWEVHPISKSVLDLYPIPRGVSQGHKVYLGVYGMLIWHLKA